MAAETTRVHHPYPSEHTDPWYDHFVAFANSLDASDYAAREDRHLVFQGGGTFTWNSGTGALAWSATISITAPITGFVWTIPAGSVTLDTPGKVFYVNLSRAPTTNVALTALTALQVPSTDSALMVAIRGGTNCYFRNGKMMENGNSVVLFDEAGSGGGFGITGQRVRSNVAMTINEGTDQSTYVTSGAFSLNKADYVVDGTTQEIKFKVLANVTNVITTGSVQLYNLTDATVVDTRTFTATATTEALSAVLTLPTGNKVYEVRIKVTGGTPPADRVNAMWAGLQIDNVVA